MSNKVEVFDSRRNQLGEGPTATGLKNNHIQWCDIYGQAVRWRDLDTGAIGEYSTNEAIGFQIPRKTSGEILGTANGPILRDSDGKISKLPTREDADGAGDKVPLRWNDAKVSPSGDLFLGSMAYSNQSDEGSFYKLSKDGKKLTRLFSNVGISNGLDWSMDGKRMFYIDTLTMRVDLFDVEESQISNRRPFIKIDDGMGYPDGMSMDTDDNLWVAFWQGFCVRGFDGTNGKQIAEIKVPSANATSCVFGGEKLDKLIITSAVGNPGESADLEKYPESGFVFITSTGTTGKRTNLFGL